MFTGIIEELGVIKKVIKKTGNSLLEIRAAAALDGARTGSSIAVNGVCLTVLEVKKTSFIAEVTKESLVRSNLSGINTGSRVNLERPLKAEGRFDGHIVMGHVDSTGIIREITKGQGYWRIAIEVERGLSKYIVDKGSVAVDGISLTVTECTGNLFTLNIIPHTFESTTLKERVSGDKVNIETDLVAKYIEKFYAGSGLNKNISKEFLNENGYTV